MGDPLPTWEKVCLTHKYVLKKWGGGGGGFVTQKKKKKKKK